MLQPRVNLSLQQRPKYVVLDEADRMLDIGFRPDIERILRNAAPTVAADAAHVAPPCRTRSSG